jgi:hypothetical protein
MKMPVVSEHAAPTFPHVNSTQVVEPRAVQERSTAHSTQEALEPAVRVLGVALRMYPDLGTAVPILVAALLKPQSDINAAQTWSMDALPNSVPR